MMTRLIYRKPVILSKFAVLTVATFFMGLSASAQTFTQQVQQHHSGQGTVTIHHDADIDRLVNGTSAPAPAPKAAPAAKANAPTKSTPTPPPSTAASSTASAKAKAETSKTATTSRKAEKAKAEKSSRKSEKSKPQSDTTKTKPQSDTTKTKPQGDTTKTRSSSGGLPTGPATHTSPSGSDTVTTPSDSTSLPASPRRGYKTTGYRVQAFAGGNTRSDRQRAERTGNAMRQLLPGEDVYVRFYSPRWVCRVGNYLTYEEAHEKMLLIRKLGYESATIVKGKIIVYYDRD